MLLQSTSWSVNHWALWFAWRPVMAFSGDPDRPFRRLWLSRVYRRRHRRGQWQYKTFECQALEAALERPQPRSSSQGG
ncbi:hypothetical protein [Aureimonas sp. AU22]|uniref:hypothetical protein n=1 Tax=Aureimonas sp. AU22 TaxID=1638162 RepID=UPI000A9DCB3F|nr:hypothetical protein [Aureimonas sp. AU22]